MHLFMDLVKISNMFWQDVIKVIKSHLWETDAIIITPLWLSPIFDKHIIKDWFKKGITTIADFLDL